MKINVLFLMLTVSLCAFVLTAGFSDYIGSPGNSGDNLSNSPSFSSNNDLNTVPIETAYNESLAAFWSFTLDGPYSSDPNWTSAALDPEPVILYDINSKPQYYEFYVRNGNDIPGYIWTAANRLLGHGIFRIYEGPPSYNH